MPLKTQGMTSLLKVHNHFTFMHFSPSIGMFVIKKMLWAVANFLDGEKVCHGRLLTIQCIILLFEYETMKGSSLRSKPQQSFNN